MPSYRDLLLSPQAVQAGAQAIYLPSAYLAADEVGRAGMHARAENCIRAALDTLVDVDTERDLDGFPPAWLDHMARAIDRNMPDDYYDATQTAVEWINRDLGPAYAAERREAQRVRAVLLRERDPEELGSLAYQLRALARIVEGGGQVARRDDPVAAFIKRHRDYADEGSERWDALDTLLDIYREHADTGEPLRPAKDEEADL